MDKQFKECMKPHAMVHTLFGIGLGLVLANWLTSLTGQTGLVIGLFVILIGFMFEFYLAGQRKK